MPRCLCIFLFAFSLWLFDAAQAQTIGDDGRLLLNGEGTPTATKLFSSYAEAYSYANDGVLVEYTASNSLVAMDDLQNVSITNRLSFGAIQDFYAQTAVSRGLEALPFVAFGITFPYRLDAAEALNKTVVLDELIIADIYLGVITQWDDSRIAELNPDIPLPSIPIRPVIYGSDNVHCITFSLALSTISPLWNSTVIPNGFNYIFPIDDWPTTLNSTNGDAIDTYTLVEANDGAIGFAIYSEMLAAGINPNYRQAALRRFNNTVYFSIDAISTAVDSFVHDANAARNAFFTFVVNSPDPQAWPFCSLDAFIIEPTILGSFSGGRCEDQAQFVSFVTWIQTNEAARALTESLGFSALPISLRTQVQDFMASINCSDGEAAARTTIVLGSGEAGVAPMIQGGGLVFSATEGFGNTEIKFEISSIEATSDSLITHTDIKFASLASAFTSEAYDSAPDLVQFPAFAVGLAIAYNIPDITAYTEATGAAPAKLVLTADIIAAIYMNDIQYWDDAKIVDLNPLLASLLPHQPISIVVPDNISAATLVFTETLSKMTQLYSIEPVSVRDWPVPSNRVVSSQADDTYTGLLNTNYSFGYVGYPALNIKQLSFTTAVQEALVYNKQGNAVGPYPDNVKSAILDFGISSYTYNPTDSRKRATSTPSLISSLVAGSGAQSYPFSSYGYMALRSQAHEGNCKALQGLLDFVVWIQAFSGADAVLAKVGAANLTQDIETQVLEALATIECGGTKALNIAGCLVAGVICSDRGSCLDGQCLCTPGYSGKFCQDDTGSTNTAVIYGAVIGSVVPVLLFCCCLFIVLVVLIIALATRKKDRAWTVDFEDIELKQQIGAGGYGAVHKGVWKDSDVAVKLLANTGHLTREMKSNFISEVKVMTQLRHPNVVLFMGACTKPPNLCIIMEFMELGSLYDVLHNELVPVLPMSLKIKLATQAAQGMHFLHSSGILHRDLKSPNILLDDKWNAKISDFGLTKFANESNSDIDRMAGSLFWTAPEILGEEMPFCEASDVYSFGIILWELLTMQDPYMGLNPTTVAVCVLRDDLRPKVPENAPPDYAELMRNCWDKQLDVRPTFLEVVTRLKLLASSSTSGEESNSPKFSLESTRLDGTITITNSSSSDSDQGNVKKLAAVDNAVRAPAGEVTIVFTDIYRAGALWEFDPDVMKDATILHNAIIRAAARETSGYEVHITQAGAISGEGSFCFAFQRPDDAVRWTVMVQERLMAADWHDKLLAHPAATEEWAGQDDETIFKGLRVKMGLNIGSPRAVRDPLTRRMEYAGPVVVKAAQLTSLAHGGQILASSTLFKALKNEHKGLKELVVVKALGEVEIGADSGHTTTDKVFEIKPKSLTGRFFGGLVHRAERSGLMSNRSQSDRHQQYSIKDFSSLSLHSTSGSASTQSIEMDNLGPGADQSYLNSANLCRWVLDYENIEVGKQIGMGSYGMVYKARWKGVDVAVKRFIKQKLSERHMLEFRAEVAFLSEMHHPNIVLFIGACLRKPNLCIVTEYVKQGSLKDVLVNKSLKLPWQLRMKIAKGAALGVYYLHSLDPIIVHRDLKSSNILIDENWNAKVADFGFARIKQDNATMTRCGSPCWTAPEVIQGHKYTEKADVYSFGIILWEILTRQQPYKGQNYMNVGLDVVNGHRPKLPSNTPKHYARLITRCWRGEAEKRPSMRKVVSFFDKENRAEADTTSDTNTTSTASQDEMA